MKTIKNRNGMALVTVLVIVAVLTVLGTVVWHYSTRDVIGASRAEKKMQAYYLARSGADALAQYITTNPDNIDMDKYIDSIIGIGDSQPAKIHNDINGTFSVRIEKSEPGILITSTGEVDNIKQIASLTINKDGVLPLLDAALFSSGRISVTSKINGDVVTNSESPNDINISWGGEINGDLIIGPKGDTRNIANKNFIKGDISSMDTMRTYELPPFPETPSDLPTRGSISADPNNPKVINQNGYYPSISLGGSSKLTIDVGASDRIIVVDRLSIGGNADTTINYNGGGKLILFILDTFSMGNRFPANDEFDPNNLIIYYKGTKDFNIANSYKLTGSLYVEKANLLMAGSGSVVGHILSGGKKVTINNGSVSHVKVLFAPNAHVEMAGGGGLKGALICKSFNISNGATLKYDNSILGTFPGLVESIGSGSTHYTRGLWR